jgi:4'-phosphopantetheinyl transferase
MGSFFSLEEISKPMPDFDDLSREVHLWSMPTTTFSDLDLTSHAERILSPEERQRADRFAYARDRRSYIIAHWLIRRALSSYVSVPPDAWEFARASHGKPFLAGRHAELGLLFNLSHTAGMVACGITRIGEVGVDVETIRSRDHLNLARRYFAPLEIAQLEPLSPTEQQEVFLRFWTLKEAYIKAQGLGLAMDLASFGFPEVNRKRITIEFAQGTGDSPGEWSFFRHEPDPLHKIAVAVRRPADVVPGFRIFQDIPPD